MSRTPALAIMSNDVAGSNSRRPGRRHPRQARGGVAVRDGPRPPGLHLLFPLAVESTQITKSADHRGPKNLFLSGTSFRKSLSSPRAVRTPTFARSLYMPLGGISLPPNDETETLCPLWTP